MKGVPEFGRRDYESVRKFAAQILAHKGQPDHTYLVHLTAHDDGHFRAVFHPDYFVRAEGRDRPSKSQWSGLKKKLKRHDHNIFIFKEHGVVERPGVGECYYIDFGFFR